MEFLWPIAFGAAAGVFAYLGQCVEDFTRVGWKAYFSAFVVAKRLRNSMLIQLLCCMAGGAVFGLIVVIVQAINS